MQRFVDVERQAQCEFFESRFPGVKGYGGAQFCLEPQSKYLNLAPVIQSSGPAYFSQNRIAWHKDANNALSSQVCCLNFLMPMAEKPLLLARLIGRALGIDPPEMLPVEAGPSGEPWFVGFEWIGREDYLNEAGSTGARTRGANVTSADAFVRFRHAGRTEGLLIEWKYTERYGSPIDPKGNAVRERRYSDLAFAPGGPIRCDLGLQLTDFFYEPFYQLLRQQMLACYMQKAGEDGVDRMRVLHISPAANTALRKVTAPALRQFGDSAFSAFPAVLSRPDDFVSVATEEVFAPPLASTGPETVEWADYLRERYGFLKWAACLDQAGA